APSAFTKMKDLFTFAPVLSGRSLVPACILLHFAHSEREFIPVNKYLDWTSAQTYCRDKYTDLVTVYDEQDNQKLMAVAGNMNECFWIGLRHNFDNWRWSMGVPSRFYDKSDDIWADGEPNNWGGIEHCGVISTYSSTGIWDRECTASLYFVC
uniref:C-type lectin domain-containing protein n=1 Tax=Periophthalmus magnuspinnatus TaxID=409849 RepID=A0A3B4ASL1_9GOBI